MKGEYIHQLKYLLLTNLLLYYGELGIQPLTIMVTMVTNHFGGKGLMQTKFNVQGTTCQFKHHFHGTKQWSYKDFFQNNG